MSLFYHKCIFISKDGNSSVRSYLPCSGRGGRKKVPRKSKTRNGTYKTEVQ